MSSGGQSNGDMGHSAQDWMDRKRSAARNLSMPAYYADVTETQRLKSNTSTGSVSATNTAARSHAGDEGSVVARLARVVDTYRAENRELSQKLAQISEQLRVQRALRHEQREGAGEEARDRALLLERMQRRSEQLETELRALTDREASVKRSLDAEREQAGREASRLRDALVQKAEEEAELLAIMERRDNEAADAHETIRRLSAQLETARHCIAHECVARSTHEQLLRDVAELDSVSVPRARLVAVEQELKQLRSSVEKDYVPLSKYEELSRKYNDLHAFVRHDTVAVSAFTDIVLKYDELEAAIQSDYVPQSRLVELKTQLREGRDEKLRLHQSLVALEAEMGQALARAAAQEERAVEAEEGRDRARAEARRMQERADGLSQQLQSAERERDHFRELYSQSSQATHRLESENASLLVQLGNARADLSLMQRHSRSVNYSTILNNSGISAFASAAAAVTLAQQQSQQQQHPSLAKYPPPMTLPVTVHVPSVPPRTPPRGILDDATGPELVSDGPSLSATSDEVFVWRRGDAAARRRSEEWQRPDLFAASPIRSPTASGKSQKSVKKTKKEQNGDSDGLRASASNPKTPKSAKNQQSPTRSGAKSALTRSTSNLSSASSACSIATSTTSARRVKSSPPRTSLSNRRDTATPSFTGSASNNRTPTRMASFTSRSSSLG